MSTTQNLSVNNSTMNPSLLSFIPEDFYDNIEENDKIFCYMKGDIIMALIISEINNSAKLKKVSYFSMK